MRHRIRRPAGSSILRLTTELVSSSFAQRSDRLTGRVDLFAAGWPRCRMGRGSTGAGSGLPVTIRAGGDHVTAASGDTPVKGSGSCYTGWCQITPVQEPCMTVYQGTSFTPGLTAGGYALFRAGVKVSAGTCE